MEKDIIKKGLHYMKKRKLHTKSKSLQKQLKKSKKTKLKKLIKTVTVKPKVTKRVKIRGDHHDDDDLHNHEENLQEETHYLDDFEQLQDLAHEPGTLSTHHEEEEEEEVDLVEAAAAENNNKIEIKEPIIEEPENEEVLTARGNKNKHYVKPEEFEAQIQKYYKNGVLTNDLCDHVYKIATRLSYRPNFARYSFREEMVGDAIERMIFALTKKIYKYDPKKIGKNGKKGNAFLYFTKIAENAFINRIKIESKNREAITNYQEEVYRNLLQKGIDIGKTADLSE